MSSRQRGITLVGPLLARTSPQARTGGYTADMYTLDWDRKQATCPHGTASSKWAPMRQKDGKEAISVRFPAATCRACPARDKCTTAIWTGRQLFLRPREIHQAVAAARAEEDTRQWKDRHKARAGVEGMLYQATHVAGIRRARYTGLDKTRLEHLAAATAINVVRLDAWYSGRPLDRTRTTQLQRIYLAPAAEPELSNRISVVLCRQASEVPHPAGMFSGPRRHRHPAVQREADRTQAGHDPDAPGDEPGCPGRAAAAPATRCCGIPARSAMRRRTGWCPRLLCQAPRRMRRQPERRIRGYSARRCASKPMPGRQPSSGRPSPARRPR